MLGLSRLSFRSKLGAVLLVPLAGVALLGGLGVRVRYQNAKEMSGIHRLVDLSQQIGAVAHQLQIERGRTAGYLGFGGAQFADELSAQHASTDDALARLRGFLNDVFPAEREELGQRGYANLQDALARLEELPSMRNAVSKQSITAQEAITYYSDVNRSFLDSIAAMPTVARDGEVSNAFSAYSAFLQLKEATGIERAILVNTFARNSFGDGMFVRFVKLLGEQTAYLHKFACSASPEDLAFYRQSVRGPAVDEVADYEQAALDHGEQGGFGLSARRWFDAMTDKINLQMQVEDHLAQRLASVATSAIDSANAARNGYAAITIATVLLSAILAGSMARSIARPIQDLADTVRRVGAGPNYSLRATTTSADEIGSLVDGFNEMLGQIEQRDAQLLMHRDHLEGLVAERTRLSALTAEVALAVTKRDTPRAVLQRCAEAVVHHLDAAFARIWTLNEDQQVLELQASAGLYTHIDGAHGRVKVGEFKIGKIAGEGKPHLTNHVVGDPRVGDQEWARREGMVAFAGYPLIVGDRLVGVLAMFARRALDPSALDALCAAADSIALGIERFETEEGLFRAMEAKAVAEVASQAKSEFLARMSHEIRTPLTSILGFTDLLRRKSVSDSQRGEYLETIKSSGRYLSVLIDDILDLSKIEAGRMKFERVRCSPHRIISEVLSVLRVRACKKNLHLECHWASGVPETILTDPAALKQLLINLVGNAIKFTEQGGVELTARIDPNWPEPRFMIEVRDTGIGIPPERIESIFAPFEQADSSITRRYGGTGLGLTISRHIALALGGSITVESEPGRGSVFRLALETGPLDDVLILDAPPSETFESFDKAHGTRIPALAPARVLVVEDGDTNRQLIRAVLEEAGAEVECAENGQIGFELATREAFDAIVMDMQMPVMDGYSATRRLRDAGCQLPIIALTAHAMRGDKEKCLAAGCSDYLPKPINLDALLAAVESAVKGTGCRSADAEATARQTAVAPSHRGTIASTLPMDRPAFRHAVESFVQRLPERLEEMQSALAESDLNSLAELAHWLKGTGGTVGFHCFTEPARKLERLARGGQTDAIPDCLLELKKLADELVVPT